MTDDGVPDGVLMRKMVTVEQYITQLTRAVQQAVQKGVTAGKQQSPKFTTAEIDGGAAKFYGLFINTLD